MLWSVHNRSSLLFLHPGLFPFSSGVLPMACNSFRKHHTALMCGPSWDAHIPPFLLTMVFTRLFLTVFFPLLLSLSEVFCSYMCFPRGITSLTDGPRCALPWVCFLAGWNYLCPAEEQHLTSSHRAPPEASPPPSLKPCHINLIHSYQHCLHHKSKAQHCVSCSEESQLHPSQTQDTLH